MKAVIKNLWNTDREVIGWEGSDTEYPSSISELKKADNVLVGGHNAASHYCEIMLDDNIVEVNVAHICSANGTIVCVEVL